MRRRGDDWRYPWRSDRGDTTTVREGGAATGVTHRDLIAAALRQYVKEGRQRYPQKSDRGGTAVVREGGVVVGFTHGDLIAAALRQ